jgi:hypothetical protein
MGHIHTQQGEAMSMGQLQWPRRNNGTHTHTAGRSNEHGSASVAPTWLKACGDGVHVTTTRNTKHG